MAPTRGFRRAIIAIAATSIAARFSLRQRSAPEPVPVPTVTPGVSGLTITSTLHDDAAGGATGQAPAKSQ